MAQEFGDAIVSYTPRISAPTVGWTVDPRWYALNLTLGMAPTISQATVRLDYGRIKRRGARTFQTEPRLENWFGQFCRIEVPNAAIDWSGVILRQRDAFGSGDYGTQYFTVSDYSWYLARAFYGWSVCESPSQGGKITTRRALGFNTGWGYHRDAVDNTQYNKSKTGNVFSTSPDDREPWTAENAVDYLLKEHINDASAPVMPRTLELSSFARPYLQYIPAVRAEGRTLWELLNKLIPTARGLCWFIDWAQTSGPFTLNVTSMSPSPINLPGGQTIPAALIQRNVQNLSAEAQLQIDVRQDRKRNGVIVRGAAQRCVYTTSVQSQGLAEGWQFDTPAYDLYRNAGKGHPNHPDYDTTYTRQQKVDTNDGIRTHTELLSPIFSQFAVPNDWNLESYNGEIFSTVWDPEAAAEIPYAHIVPASRMSGLLPLIAGADYSIPTVPDNLPPPGNEIEFAAPMAFANKSPEGESPFYVPVQMTGGQKGKDDPALKTSYVLQVSRGRPGVIIHASGKPAHTAARGVLSTEDMEPTDVNPEIDYREILYTVAAETSYYAEGRYPDLRDDAPIEEFDQTAMLVLMGDRFRYDTILPGTVWGVEDGELKVTGNTDVLGGTLRDDRPDLRDLARLAYEWYATLRGTMTLRTGLNTTSTLGLSMLVLKAGYNTPDYEVNATVSKIQCDFVNGFITYSAGFVELDFGQLL